MVKVHQPWCSVPGHFIHTKKAGSYATQKAASHLFMVPAVNSLTAKYFHVLGDQKVHISLKILPFCCHL